jgi:methylamine dehydrogenase accessory protein MauD
LENPFQASVVVLWIVVLALGFLALAHSRLIGLLLQRIGPGIARPVAEGPPVGTRVEKLQATTLFGQSWTKQFPAENESLAIFISPQCQACNELMPHVKDFLGCFGARAELHLFSLLSDPAMNRAYVDFAKLEEARYLIADRLAAKLQVTGTPYGFKFDRNGVILAKGIVNHFEHLVSLWNVAGSTAAFGIKTK